MTAKTQAVVSLSVPIHIPKAYAVTAHATEKRIENKYMKILL